MTPPSTVVVTPPVTEETKVDVERVRQQVAKASKSGAIGDVERLKKRGPPLKQRL